MMLMHNENVCITKWATKDKFPFANLQNSLKCNVNYTPCHILQKCVYVCLCLSISLKLCLRLLTSAQHVTFSDQISNYEHNSLHSTIQGLHSYFFFVSKICLCDLQNVIFCFQFVLSFVSFLIHISVGGEKWPS